jgi:NAD(P)-dependent dehydrogenase (short-subunit alcohol dehydrogenase family)
MKKVWFFITGSSRGLGKSLTLAVLAAGHSVAATASPTGYPGNFG